MNAIQTEITEDEFEQELNDLYGEVEVCGIKFNSGTILKELDHIAFRCAMFDSESRGEMWRCEGCGQDWFAEEEAEECCQENR